MKMAGFDKIQYSNSSSNNNNNSTASSFYYKMNRMNSNNHKRQSSNGSFKGVSITEPLLQTSFSSLDNFMNATKHMEDEIMVPSKLKEKKLKIVHDKQINDETSNGAITNGVNGTSHANNNNINNSSSDVLDHYKFIQFVRNQFLHSKPFSTNNIDDYNNNELKDSYFKKTYDDLSYHYNELMSILDNLSNEAKLITEVYRESV